MIQDPQANNKFTSKYIFCNVIININKCTVNQINVINEGWMWENNRLKTSRERAITSL